MECSFDVKITLSAWTAEWPGNIPSFPSPSKARKAFLRLCDYSEDGRKDMSVELLETALGLIAKTILIENNRCDALRDVSTHGRANTDELWEDDD